MLIILLKEIEQSLTKQINCFFKEEELAELQQKNQNDNGGESEIQNDETEIENYTDNVAKSQ